MGYVGNTNTCLWSSKGCPEIAVEAVSRFLMALWVVSMFRKSLFLYAEFYSKVFIFEYKQNENTREMVWVHTCHSWMPCLLAFIKQLEGSGIMENLIFHYMLSSLNVWYMTHLCFYSDKVISCFISSQNSTVPDLVFNFLLSNQIRVYMNLCVCLSTSSFLKIGFVQSQVIG